MCNAIRFSCLAIVVLGSLALADLTERIDGGGVADLADGPRGFLAHRGHVVIQQRPAQAVDGVIIFDLAERPGGFLPHFGVGIGEGAKERLGGFRLADLAEGPYRPAAHLSVFILMLVVAAIVWFTLKEVET